MPTYFEADSDLDVRVKEEEAQKGAIRSYSKATLFTELSFSSQLYLNTAGRFTIVLLLEIL